MGPRFNGVEDETILAGLMAGETASMGPRFNGVEDEKLTLQTRILANASMGPRFNGVEDHMQHEGRKESTGRFNGATL